MRVIADLHIHGRYSRATSEQMSIPQIAKYAKIKGLNLVGTGDFTHPQWLKEINETLIPEERLGPLQISQYRFSCSVYACKLKSAQSSIIRENQKKCTMSYLLPGLKPPNKSMSASKALAV